MFDAGTILMMLAFGGLFGAVYSYYFGTSKILEVISLATGGIASSIIDIYSNFSSIVSTGLSNFFEPGYFGYSMLIVGLTMFIAIMALNIITTLDTNPRAIR